MRVKAVIAIAFLAGVLFYGRYEIYGQETVLSLQSISGLYRTGDIEELEKKLQDFVPESDTEKAAKLYYQARLSVSKDDMLRFWEELIKRYPQTEYGSHGFLELAKIALLERRYDDSREYLLALPPDPDTLSKLEADLQDRDLLLSTVYLKLNRFDSAISSAQRFINITTDNEKKETAYLNIVEAHILSGSYDKALSVTKKMRDEQHIVNQGCVVTFKEGYALEMLDDVKEAVRKYRQVITHFPYTEHSYQAEKRLYELFSLDRISSAELTTPAPGRTERKINNDDDVLPPVAVNTDSEQYYVQVNAFSIEKNAVNHSLHLKRSGFENRVITRIVNEQNLYVVAVGPYISRVDAVAAQQKIKDRLNLDSFIIRH